MQLQISSKIYKVGSNKGRECQNCRSHLHCLQESLPRYPTVVGGGKRERERRLGEGEGGGRMGEERDREREALSFSPSPDKRH